MSEDNEKKHSEGEDQAPDSDSVVDHAGEPLEEALKDPRLEALKKYASTMGFLVVAVFAVFLFAQWREGSKQESQDQLNTEYLEAVESSESGDPGGLLTFADKHKEAPLAGPALYLAAAQQYAKDDFATAAETYGRAAALFAEDEENPLPLAGRAALGQGISLIKADKVKQGKAILLQVAQNTALVPSSRGEAWHHLGIQALTEGDDAGYEQAEKALADDKTFANWSDTLTRSKSSSDFIAKATQRRKLTQAEKNLALGVEFLAENKKRKGVVTLESGLQYEVLAEGNGTSPKAEDEVQVHYHGTLLNGEVFDSSVERKSPSRFGLGGVIAGWTEGLQLMKTGGRWKFFIPPELAYKSSGRGNIGPNETLTFEVVLLQVFPKPPAPKPVADGNGTTTPPSVFRPDANGTIVIPPSAFPPTGNGSIVIPPTAPRPEGNGSK